MTKEELKEKIITDPEARKKFIAATTEYYKAIGLNADHKDLATLSDQLRTPAMSTSPRIIPIIVPIIVWFPVKEPVKEEDKK
jgi:hypothetical protein